LEDRKSKGRRKGRKEMKKDERKNGRKIKMLRRKRRGK